MTTATTINTQDILLKLCGSVSKVLSAATHNPVQQAQMIQTVGATSLRPDIGCFVLFDGGFSGLVIINFEADAAMELYRDYLLNMGMSESDLATLYTSDEVANVMGELMNQIVGDFTGKVSHQLQSHITQSQPKMLTVQKQLTISINANLHNPVFRRVAFSTKNHNVFYLEFAMDDTEFTALDGFESGEELSPDDLLASHTKTAQTSEAPANDNDKPQADDDLLNQLGI